jgi:hypothetical protein
MPANISLLAEQVRILQKQRHRLFAKDGLAGFRSCFNQGSVGIGRRANDDGVNIVFRLTTCSGEAVTSLARTNGRIASAASIRGSHATATSTCGNAAKFLACSWPILPAPNKPTVILSFFMSGCVYFVSRLSVFIPPYKVS